MKTEDKRTEKEKVVEYVASLPGLDRYVSDDIDLLPGKLYTQALEYWKYEYEVERMRENGKVTSQELEAMQFVSKIMKGNLDRDLQDLLRKYGYRFGEPDSLQNNVRQRLEDLQEEYHAREGKEATPLLVDAWCVMKDDPKHREFRMTFQFDGEEIDDDNITVVNGINALVELAGTDNHEFYNITQVMNMYGNVYNVEITECLVARETVEARTREEADEMVSDKLDSKELILDSENFNSVEIKLLGEESNYHLGPALFASPDNLRHVSVIEYLVKVVKKEGKDRDEVVNAVERDWKDGKIVLDADNFAYRAISPAFQLVDNTLELPKRLFPVTQYELLQRFRNHYPNGMIVNLRKESVEHLLELAENQYPKLVGLVNDKDNTILSAYGELQAEIRMTGENYREVWPDSETYYCKEFENVLDREQNTCTTFLYLHPDLTGGRVSVDLSPSLRNSLYIERVPFSKAIELIRTRGISTDKEFRQAAAAYRQVQASAGKAAQTESLRQQADSERLSDITVIQTAPSKVSIRCKVNGMQQMAVPVSSKDRILLSNELTTKEDMALKYFWDELKTNPEQKQNRGMKR